MSIKNEETQFVVYSSILIFLSGVVNIIFSPLSLRSFWGYIFMYIGIFSTLRWYFPKNRVLQLKDRTTVRLVFCYLFYWMLNYNYFDELEKWFLSGIGINIFFYYCLAKLNFKKCIFHLIMHMYVIFGSLCLTVMVKK